MKKFLLLAVLAALTLFAGKASAQYHDDSPDNTTYDGGLSGRTYQPLKTRLFITWHYQASDPEFVKHKITEAVVAEMNYYSRNHNSTLVFEPVDYGVGEDQGLNFTLFFDFYSNGDGTYRIYECVHGWGAGHLFRRNQLNVSQDGIADALTTLSDDAARLLAFGWTPRN